HSAGIRPRVSFIQALVIACRSQHSILIARDQHVERTFPTFEEFLDQNLRASSSEPRPINHVLDRLLGARRIRSNDYHFARRKPICLDHRWVMQSLRKITSLSTVVENT